MDEEFENRKQAYLG